MDVMKYTGFLRETQCSSAEVCLGFKKEQVSCPERFGANMAGLLDGYTRGEAPGQSHEGETARLSPLGKLQS